MEFFLDNAIVLILGLLQITTANLLATVVKSMNLGLFMNSVMGIVGGTIGVFLARSVTSGPGVGSLVVFGAAIVGAILGVVAVGLLRNRMAR